MQTGFQGEKNQLFYVDLYLNEKSMTLIFRKRKWNILIHNLFSLFLFKVQVALKTTSFVHGHCDHKGNQRLFSSYFLTHFLWLRHANSALIFCYISENHERHQQQLLCQLGARHKDPFKNTTLFENHRKSHIQHCERSELRLRFQWTKVH